MNSRILVVALSLIACHACAEDPAAPVKSTRFSCFDKTFLSVAASRRERDHIPRVDISLTDPLGRVAGATKTKSKKIPTASYKPVFELPDVPAQSTVLAIEVCDAPLGTYEVTLNEIGDEPYRLTVHADGNADNSETLALYHTSRVGRARRYRFVLRIEKPKLLLSWLDKQGKETRYIEWSEW